MGKRNNKYRVSFFFKKKNFGLFLLRYSFLMVVLRNWLKLYFNFTKSILKSFIIFFQCSCLIKLKNNINLIMWLYLFVRMTHTIITLKKILKSGKTYISPWISSKYNKAYSRVLFSLREQTISRIDRSLKLKILTEFENIINNLKVKTPSLSGFLKWWNEFFLLASTNKWNLSLINKPKQVRKR